MSILIFRTKASISPLLGSLPKWSLGVKRLQANLENCETTRIMVKQNGIHAHIQRKGTSIVALVPKSKLCAMALRSLLNITEIRASDPAKMELAVAQLFGTGVVDHLAVNTSDYDTIEPTPEGRETLVNHRLATPREVLRYLNDESIDLASRQDLFSGLPFVSQKLLERLTDRALVAFFNDISETRHNYLAERMVRALQKAIDKASEDALSYIEVLVKLGKAESAEAAPLIERYQAARAARAQAHSSTPSGTSISSEAQRIFNAQEEDGWLARDMETATGKGTGFRYRTLEEIQRDLDNE